MSIPKILFLALLLYAVFQPVEGSAQAQNYPPNVRWIKDGTEMICVPAGEFKMGSNDKRFPPENPAHKVFVKDFYINKFEVTNEKYFRFCTETGYQAPFHMRDQKGMPSGREKNPVNFVSSVDAAAYCTWAGKRLPSEEEWEKAARGTDGRTYPWGDGWDQNLSNNRTSPVEDTLPVGSIPRGASPYGLMDMAGNVWEWTSSWYKSYPGSEMPFDDTGKNKVVRGGAYFYSIDLLRSPYRHPLPPDDKSEYGGFRCAVDADRIKLTK